MAYTKSIKLSDKAKTRLCSYIDDELNRHYMERGDLIKELSSWQFDYDATPSVTINYGGPIDSNAKMFPFNGAATLIIPLAAITVEAVHARTMTTMFALEQFTTAKAQSSKWERHTRPVERFLDQELLDRMKIRKPINDSLLETTKYGTGIAKTGYTRKVKTVVREINGRETDYEYVVKQGATIEAVPLSRFLMPMYYQDPQEAPWCGEEHEYSPYQVRQEELSGLFDDGVMEKLNSHFSQAPATSDGSGREFTENQEKAEKAEPVWPEKIVVQELWMSFDVEDIEGAIGDTLNPYAPKREEFINGFDKEIVIFYHKDSQTILSVRYNPYEDLRRPYVTGVYFPVEHRWRGIGAIKQVEQFQREITTQHRQRIDNATLANCRMFKVSKLSDYGPNEPIFPGKIWWVDNMEEVQTLQMGEVYSSSYNNELALTKSIWECRKLGHRAPQLPILQEFKKETRSLTLRTVTIELLLMQSSITPF